VRSYTATVGVISDIATSALHVSPISPCSILAVKCLVDFLTILWHSSTEDCVFHATASSFFTSAATFLKNQCSNSFASLMLRNTLLVAISQLSRNCSFDDVKLIQEWLVRSSLVHSGRSDFIAACMNMGSISAGQLLISVHI